VTTRFVDCWPTAEQRFLLRAALLDGPLAVDAWHEWRRRVELDDLDEASARLLPQLAHNLSVRGVEDPLLSRLRGVRRRVWTQNTERLIETAAIVRMLEEAGVPTMILKGAALATMYYPDRGLRPMTDSDVLVPTRQARFVMALLRDRGWTPWDGHQRRPELTIGVHHAHEFRHPNGPRLDLHWHVLWERGASEADDDFWAAAVPLDLRGTHTRTLCPTDQLLHVCVHGARWSGAPSLRWAADAHMILHRRDVYIDWDHLVRQARRHRLVLPVRATLSLLAEMLETPVPPGVLADLRGIAVPWTQRVEYATGARAVRGLGTGLLNRACHHHRLSERRSFARSLLGFPRYLRLSYERETYRELVGVIARKVRRRIAKRLGRPDRPARPREGPDATRASGAGRGPARSWLNRPPWMPVDAPVRSTPSARSRARLLDVVAQFDVEMTARYRPVPTPQGPTTWCNIFVWDATRALGAEIPHCVDEAGCSVPVGQGRELTANRTLRWLEAHGATAGWRESDAAGAVRAAQGGLPAVAIWHNPFGPGHVALVVPCDAEGVHVAQAGAVCFSSRPLAHGFGERPARFFVHA
jgi:hypothetical protein